MGVNGAFCCCWFSGAFKLPDLSRELKALDGGAKDLLIKFELAFEDCCSSTLSGM